MDNVEYIRELVGQIKSSTQPISGRIDNDALATAWSEIDNTLTKLHISDAATASAGVNKVVDVFRKLLMDKYPDAELMDESVADNSGVLVFKAKGEMMITLMVE